jgi:TP901 family phage tail tape measure protein
MAKTRSSGGGFLAGAWVEIQLRTSKFAQGLIAARRMLVSVMSGMARVSGRMATAPFRGVATAVRRVTRSLRGLLASILPLLGPLAALGSLVAAIMAVRGAVRTFADFEQRMARVNAITGATVREFRSLTDQARALGRTTSFTAAQAAEAMGNFAVAGFEVKEIMGAMQPTLDLAAAGQLDMATASDIVAKIMRGMGLEAGELTRVVDVLTRAFTTSNTNLQDLGEAFKFVGPIAKVAGVDVEATAAAIQVLSDAGMGASLAGTSLRRILSRLSGGTKATNDAFKKLGVAMTLDGKVRPLADIIEDLSVAMDKLGMGAAQRTAFFIEAFGDRAGPGMAVLVERGATALRAFEADLRKAGGTAARIRDIQLNTLNGALTIMRSAFADAAITIGGSFRRALTLIAVQLQRIAPVVGEIVGMFEDSFTMVGFSLAGFIRNIRQTLEQLRPIFARVADFVSLAFTDPIGTVQAAFKVLVAFIQDIFNRLMAMFKTFGQFMSLQIDFMGKRIEAAMAIRSKTKLKKEFEAVRAAAEVNSFDFQKQFRANLAKSPVPAAQQEFQAFLEATRKVRDARKWRIIGEEIARRMSTRIPKTFDQATGMMTDALETSSGFMSDNIKRGLTTVLGDRGGTSIFSALGKALGGESGKKMAVAFDRETKRREKGGGVQSGLIEFLSEIQRGLFEDKTQEDIKRATEKTATNTEMISNKLDKLELGTARFA